MPAPLEEDNGADSRILCNATAEVAEKDDTYTLPVKRPDNSMVGYFGVLRRRGRERELSTHAEGVTPLECINVPVDLIEGEGGTNWATWVSKLQLGGEGVKVSEQGW